MAKFLSKINSPDYAVNRIPKIDSNKDLVPSNITLDGTTSSLLWKDGAVQQRILITDDNAAGSSVFTFQQSTNTGTSFTDLLTIKDNGEIIANKFTGTLNGNANSSTQIKVTETSPSTAAKYNLVFTNAANTSNADLRINSSDATLQIQEGTTSVVGCDRIWLGNSIKKGNNNNKYGSLLLYSFGAGYNQLYATESDENFTNYLPAADGTLLNTGNYMNYALPLSGGTITGNLIVNGTIEGKTTITANTDLITKSGIVNLNDNALIQYNETDECIEFIFP